MSQRRTAPSRLPEGGGLGPDRLSLESEINNSCLAGSRQWVPCALATLPMVIVGTVYGWTTTSLLHLTSGTGGVPLTLTHDQSSWSVSITVLGSMFGASVTAQLADRIGRIYCLLVCSMMLTIGWFHICSVTSVTMLSFARWNLGIGVGMARTIIPMFVSEVADIKFRGSIGVLIAANIHCGSLLSNALEPSLTYTLHLLVLAVISCISFTPLIFLRETPYFLVAKGEKERACKSIAYYRGIKDHDRVKVELRALRVEARYGLYQQFRSYLPSESGSDAPPPYSSIYPTPSSSDLPPPYISSISLPPSSDLPPPYTSNLPSQSIRETHSDPIRQVVGIEATSDSDLTSSSDSHSQSMPSVHILTTDELRVEYSRGSSGIRHQTLRDLHRPPTSQIHRPSTSEVHRPSTSQIHPDPACEMHRPSTSGVHRPSTCEVHRTSTSQIHRPSTSQIHPDPACDMHRPSTSEVHRPSTSQIHRPSTSQIHPDPACDMHRPSTSEVHRPSTSQIHRPSTSQIHPDPACDMQRPSTSGVHRPSTSGVHRPSTSEVHRPSTSQIHRPSTSQIHPHPACEMDRPSTSGVHRPSTSQIHPHPACEMHRPSTSGVHRPFTSQIHPDPACEMQRPSTSGVHRPSTCEVHRPSTSQIHRPSTSQIHPDPACDMQRPSTSGVHRPSTSQIHRPSTSQIHPDPACEMHRPSTSGVHRPSTSQIHRPSTSQILPQPTSELHSQSRGELRTQSSVDSRESSDLSEPYIDGTRYTCLNKLRAMLQRSNRKALFIMLGLIMAQQLSGNFSAMEYLQDLISKEKTFINQYNAMILVRLLCLFSGYLTALIVDWCGRRKLLFMSTLGLSYTSFVLAGYLFLSEHKNDDSTVSFLLCIHLILFQVFFQIGLGTLPNVLLCELFPTKLKGFVGAIVVIFDGIIGFAASKLNQVITDNIGSYGNYFIFSILCGVAFLMVFVSVPETKGKTYREIEALLGGENFNSLDEEVRTDEMEMHRI